MGLTLGLLALTALCIAAPIMIGFDDESSTAGLALLWIPVFGTLVAVLLAGAERLTQRRDRDPADR